MRVYLDYHKAARENKIIDQKYFHTKYDGKSGYKMLSGTPLIISIEGTYVKVGDLTSLVTNELQASAVNNWVSSTKQPLLADPPFIQFYWRR